MPRYRNERAEFEGEAAGLYLRVSSQGQATEDKTSLDEQERACRAYAQSIGLVVDEACVCREAYTSTTIDRPALTQLLPTLRQRKVTHLIIDKADRFSREGMVAAGFLLTLLRRDNITLHVAYEDLALVLDDERAERYFMDLMFYAKKDNALRIARIKDNNRAYARRGRYHRGNRPPYGWQYVPTQFDHKGKPVEFKLAHDPATYPTRQRILTLYQQGMSFTALAKLLTDEGVPTSSELAQQKRVAKHWHAEVIRKIVESPLNTGQATSIRQREEEAPPDERHLRRWKRWIALPLDEHIALPPDTVEPIITEEQAAIIERRVAQNKLRRLGDSWRLKGVLSSGLARCAHCGRTLYIHAMHPDGRTGKYYFYYTCANREKQREYCPNGVRVRVEELDALAWQQVCATLLEPGKLEALAAQQAALDAGDDPTSHLVTLKQTKATLEAKCQKLATSISEAQTDLTRQVLTQELDKLAVALQEAMQRITDYERVARDHQLRRKVLSDVRFQIERHKDALEVLEIEDETDRPIIRMILDSLGCVATVSREEDRQLVVTIDLNLSRASSPWFLPVQPDDIEVEVEDGEPSIEWLASNFATSTSSVRGRQSYRTRPRLRAASPRAWPPESPGPAPSAADAPSPAGAAGT
jgi:DNA invertase Pin-like site-specific DNA recombinase